MKLIGTYNSESGAKGALVLEADLELNNSGRVTSNAKLHKDLILRFQEIIEISKSDAKRIFDISNNFSGAHLYFDSPPSQTLLDNSYELPFYCEIVSKIIDIEIQKKSISTGALRDEGKLLPVGDLSIKQREAERNGLTKFVYPQSQSLQLSKGIPVENVHSALFALLDIQSVVMALENSNDHEQVIEIINDFIGGNTGSLYPGNFGELVTQIATTNSNIIEAFELFRAEWIMNIMKHIHHISESHFFDICELLDPRLDFAQLKFEANRLERFISDTLKALSKQKPENGRVAIRSAISFLKLLSSQVDLEELIKSISVRNAFNAIQSLMNKSLEIYPQIEHEEWPEFQKLIQTIYFISEGENIQPEAVKNPYLIIEPIFSKNHSLEDIVFKIPNSNLGYNISKISSPAALVDRSSVLTSKWRRKDWNIKDSAMDNLENANEVINRFGQRNVFNFSNLGGKRKEPGKIFWGDGTGTWPPSIDTLHLIGDLKKYGFYHNNKLKKVADIGCGTGVHGILLAHQNPVEQLDLQDVELGARLTTTTNVLANFNVRMGPKPISFIKGAEAILAEECNINLYSVSAMNVLKDSTTKYDLAICTPPYVPYLHVLDDPLMWKAVAGTDLLRFTLKNWKDFTNQLVIQFSEIALDEIEDVLPEEKPVAEHIVGFRIPPLRKFFKKNNSTLFRRGEQWLDLVKDRLIDSESDDEAPVAHHGFKYFHKIRTYILEA